jgi:uncharacterized membrane protein YfcA
MTGTLLNIATVLLGGAIGLLFGARISERLKATVIAGLGLFTTAIGIQMFLNTENGCELKTACRTSGSFWNSGFHAKKKMAPINLCVASWQPPFSFVWAR